MIACTRFIPAMPKCNKTTLDFVLGVEGIVALAFFTSSGVLARPAPPLGAEPAVAPLVVLIVFGVGAFKSTDCFLFAPRLSLTLGVAVLAPFDIPSPAVEMVSEGGGIWTGGAFCTFARLTSVRAI